MLDQDKNVPKFSLSRRGWITAAGSLLALGAVTTLERKTMAASGKAFPKEVEIEAFTPAGKSLGKTTVPTVVKTDAEWKKQLDSMQFEVARKEGTERAYTGKTWDNHAAGIYTCICCDTALFNSDTKFESGTGWPSFWQPISKSNVSEIEDKTFFMVRTAIACRRCDAHLGHVFDDGPKPTGLRYCMNSAAMKFVPRTA